MCEKSEWLYQLWNKNPSTQESKQQQKGKSAQLSSAQLFLVLVSLPWMYALSQITLCVGAHIGSLPLFNFPS